MINTKTSKGVHLKQQEEQAFDHSTMKLLTTQDANYIKYQSNMNKKKMNELKQELHGLGDSQHTIFVDSIKQGWKN